MQKIEYDLPIFEDNDKADLNEYSIKMATALKGQLDKFGNPLIFKGAVQTLSDLQVLTNVKSGYIYRVDEENKNYIYNDTDWVVYSDNVDLSKYQEEVNTQINKIEQEGIIVSPTEPTENRRKVWMQKGKTLFDESNYNYINANLDANGLIIAGAENYKLIYIRVEANATYKISCDKEKSLVMNTTNEVPIVGLQGTARIVVTAKEYYITTNSNAKYLCLRADTNNDIQNYFNVNLKIQKEEKIYILNDNNVYEEFMNVNAINDKIDIIDINTSDFIKLNDGFSFIESKIKKQGKHYFGHIVIEKSTNFTSNQEEVGVLRIDLKDAINSYGVSGSKDRWGIPSNLAYVYIGPLLLVRAKTTDNYIKCHIDLMSK